MSKDLEVVSYYYNPLDNWLEDYEGNLLYDIFGIISPNELMLFKEKQGTFYVNHPTRDDILYEFIFPILDEESDDWEYTW